LKYRLITANSSSSENTEERGKDNAVGSLWVKSEQKKSA